MVFDQVKDEFHGLVRMKREMGESFAKCEVLLPSKLGILWSLFRADFKLEAKTANFPSIIRKVSIASFHPIKLKNHILVTLIP